MQYGMTDAALADKTIKCESTVCQGETSVSHRCRDGVVCARQTSESYMLCKDGSTCAYSNYVGRATERPVRIEECLTLTLPALRHIGFCLGSGCAAATVGKEVGIR